MKSLKTIVLLFTLLCLKANASSIETWRAFLKTHPLSDIAEVTTNGTMSWPRLDGDGDDPALVASERSLSLEFIMKCSAEYPSRVPDPTTKNVTTSTHLIDVLEHSGGYLNAVAADTVYRMTLNEIAVSAIRDPKSAAEGTTLLLIIGSNPWTRANIGQLLASHFGNPTLVTEFGDKPTIDSLSRINSMFSNDTPKSQTVVSEPSSTSLIRKSDLRSLLYRILNTDMVSEYSLPGMLEYLNRGGALDKLTHSDVSDLDRVMGHDRTKYGFPAGGISLLRGTDLIEMKKLFNPRDSRTKFVAPALE